MQHPVTDGPVSFVSLAAVAARLSTSRKSARRWLREAGVRAFVLGSGSNGTVRYDGADVERWLLSRKERA